MAVTFVDDIVRRVGERAKPGRRCVRYSCGGFTLVGYIHDRAIRIVVQDICGSAIEVWPAQPSADEMVSDVRMRNLIIGLITVAYPTEMRAASALHSTSAAQCAHMMQHREFRHVTLEGLIARNSLVAEFARHVYNATA